MKLCKDCKHFIFDESKHSEPQCGLTIKRHPVPDMVMGKHRENVTHVSCWNARYGIDYWKKPDDTLCGQDAKHFEQAPMKPKEPYVFPSNGMPPSALETIINFFKG